jgi:hypothetical protein
MGLALGSAEEKSSVVVVRRWKALEKNYPLGSSFDAAGQRGSGDSIDETDGSGAPRSDAPGAAGGHHASSSSSSYFGPSSVNNLSLSHDIQPSSFLPGNTTTVLGTRTKSSGGIYDQIKMQLERVRFRTYGYCLNRLLTLRIRTMTHWMNFFGICFVRILVCGSPLLAIRI